MNTIRVDILNAKSLKLLETLSQLGLIAIHKEETAKNKNGDFINLVQKIRLKDHTPPSLEEITEEVEQQRAEMYAISQ